MEQVHTFRTSLNSGITVRAFAGYIFGSVPAQDQFYLSGGLTSNSSEPVSWGYEGWTSGQEHWHYDADANCRGWAGEYLHGACAYGLNVYLQPVKFIQPFFDLGNVAQNGDCPENRGLSLRRAVCDSQGLSPGFLRGTVPIFRTLWPPRMDAGIRLKLGPLYADFPIWRYSVADGRHEFAFRWTLGFRLSDLTSGS
jgi:hypothetical protein